MRLAMMALMPGMAMTLVVMLTAGAMGAAQAGGFSVSPVRLFFGERDRAVALRLSNDGEEPLMLKADVQAWSQDEHGRDRLEDSDDLIVSPTQLQVAPRSEQVVRLILTIPRDPVRQMSYRLFLREQVRATDEGLSSGRRVPIALALSLPVFITPARARHDLRCSLDVQDADTGQLHTTVAVCENKGRAHARLGRLDLMDGSSLLARHEGSVYLLPGSRRTIALTAEARQPSGEGRRLHAWLDGHERLQWEVRDGPVELGALQSGAWAGAGADSARSRSPGREASERDPR